MGNQFNDFVLPTSFYFYKHFTNNIKALEINLI